MASKLAIGPARRDNEQLSLEGLEVHDLLDLIQRHDKKFNQLTGFLVRGDLMRILDRPFKPRGLMPCFPSASLGLLR